MENLINDGLEVDTDSQFHDEFESESECNSIESD